MEEKAYIAQSVSSSPQPTPTPPPYSVDPVTAVGYFLAALAACAAIAPPLLKNWLGGEIKTRQSKADLQSEITKTHAQLELGEKQNELSRANDMASFYLETAKDGQANERKLLLLFITKELDRGAQTIDQLYELIDNNKDLATIQEVHSKQLEDIKIALKDIFNVLNMKARGDQ